MYVFRLDDRLLNRSDIQHFSHYQNDVFTNETNKKSNKKYLKIVLKLSFCSCIYLICKCLHLTTSLIIKKKENIAAYFFEKTSCSAVREAERTHEPQINFYLTGFQLIWSHFN